ncbi:MAG: hypothetical protein ABSE73_11785, partial [Planctomycetota bacterium]
MTAAPFNHPWQPVQRLADNATQITVDTLTHPDDQYFEWWVDPLDHTKAMPAGYYRWLETLLVDVAWRPAAADGTANYNEWLHLYCELLDQYGSVLSQLSLKAHLQITVGPPLVVDFQEPDAPIIDPDMPVSQFNGIRVTAEDDAGNWHWPPEKNIFRTNTA